MGNMSLGSIKKRIRRNWGRLKGGFITPQPLEVFLRSTRPIKTAVVVIAHPDDETFCSGLICYLTDHAVETRIVCMTRGEGSRSPATNPKERSAIRTSELRSACSVLGIAPATHLDVPNQPLKLRTAECDRQNLDLAKRNLATILADLSPELVVTHGSDGEYGHPDHIIANQITREYQNSTSDAELEVLTMNAWNPNSNLRALLNPSDTATFILDAQPFAKTRLESLECHRSQASVFESFAKGSLQDFVRNSSKESYHLQAR